jgi:hypothetical protein
MTLTSKLILWEEEEDSHVPRMKCNPASQPPSRAAAPCPVARSLARSFTHSTKQNKTKQNKRAKNVWESCKSPHHPQEEEAQMDIAAKIRVWPRDSSIEDAGGLGRCLLKCEAFGIC